MLSYIEYLRRKARKTEQRAVLIEFRTRCGCSYTQTMTITNNHFPKYLDRPLTSNGKLPVALYLRPITSIKIQVRRFEYKEMMVYSARDLPHAIYMETEDQP